MRNNTFIVYISFSHLPLSHIRADMTRNRYDSFHTSMFFNPFFEVEHFSQNLTKHNILLLSTCRRTLQ